MVGFKEYEDFIVSRAAQAAASTDVPRRNSNSKNSVIDWEAIDLDFDNIEEIADEMTASMYTSDYAFAGTYNDVKNEIRCIAYFGMAKRFLQILQETEFHYTRITNLVVNTKFEAPSPLVQTIMKLSAVKTSDGRCYKPRDVATNAIKALFYALHYAQLKSSKDNTDSAGPRYMLNTIEKVDFDYLDFNGGGEIRDKRSATLNARIRALATYVLQFEHISSMRLAQTILTCSSLDHLKRTEKFVLRDDFLNKEELDALYEDLPDHPNDDHRDAVRAITGDDTFSAENDAVISIQKVPNLLGAVRKIGWKIKDNFGSGSVLDFTQI